MTHAAATFPTDRSALERMLETASASPFPELTDPTARSRAVKIARRQGLLERLQRELDPKEPIPLLPYNLYRDYSRTGNRRRYERVMHQRRRRLTQAATACYLGMDRMGMLEDLVWADCETSFWVMPAHEVHGQPIDLFAAITAAQLALIVRTFGDAMAEEVRSRAVAEVRRRVLGPYLEPGRTFLWRAHPADVLSQNNWNAVCNGAVGAAALLLGESPARCAAVLAEALASLPAFLNGFTADGGCMEGPSYWRFGMGWYVYFAALAFNATGGGVDIMAGAKIADICRYPLSVNLAPGKELPFADASMGYQSPATALLINRFHDIPELLGLCRLTDDGQLAVGSLEALALYDGRTVRPHHDRSEAVLPDLGVAKLRAGRLAVGVKAGHNAEYHNHNDIGSFVVFRDGVFYLTDPGKPVYSARTFNQHRYESVFCNSLGHSVPVIDGAGQCPGDEFAGTLEVTDAADGTKVAKVDMTGAYGTDRLRSLRRRIALSGAGDRVTVTDRFAIEPAAQVTEAFMTTHPAEVVEAGSAVRIAPESASPAVLRSGSGGHFSVEELADESRAESPREVLLRRIRFTPQEVRDAMTLEFLLSLEDGSPM
ncbi:MAG: heparinase II/III domain-containing protein [Planctomycetota bacterium]